MFYAPDTKFDTAPHRLLPFGSPQNKASYGSPSFVALRVLFSIPWSLLSLHQCVTTKSCRGQLELHVNDPESHFSGLSKLSCSKIRLQPQRLGDAGAIGTLGRARSILKLLPKRPTI